MINLNLANIQDTSVKEVLENLVQQLNNLEVLRGEWDFIETTIKSPSTSAIITHKLNFKPIDYLILYKDSSLTINTITFSPTTVKLTTTGSGTVRLLVGKQNRLG